MSRSTNYTLNCPCGEVFNSKIYEYVNVSTDPQLQYTVLAGLLNVSLCPACGRRAAISRPFIYSDPAHNLLAYVYPRNDVPEEARIMILDKLSDVYTSIVGNMEQHSEQEHGASNDDKQSTVYLADQAQEMQCQIEVEDLSDEYTVWLFGSRRQIGAIMRELAARG